MQDRYSTDLIPLSSTEADLEDSRPEGPPPGLALDPPFDGPADDAEIPVDRLDADALKVIARLRHMHHRAYLVGGCVRDLLLSQRPKDFDVATDAHPGEVRAIFRNCRLIGRRFRLAHVYFRGGKVIEVATFRKNPVDVGEDVPQEGDLLITRDNVFGTAEEDAVRRDFTVNGLFYDPATGEVIDYVGGRADLEARRIATIGDPEVRIREDPVRTLRAVRFAARLGFTISPDTFEAMRRHAAELGRCAPPRVLEEIFKILRCGRSARAFELLRAAGALAVVLPALGAALEAWEEPGRRAFFAHLAALDRVVRSGEDVSDAVLLGALLVHLGAGEKDTRLEAQSLLASLVQTSRLPRKVAERTRLALHGQRMFADGARRRRRRGPAGQYFRDALQLLEISVEATGEGRETLERWRAEAGAHPAGQSEGPRRAVPREDEPARADEPAEGRAQRHGRGRRRGRRRGEPSGTIREVSGVLDPSQSSGARPDASAGRPGSAEVEPPSSTSDPSRSSDGRPGASAGQPGSAEAEAKRAWPISAAGEVRRRRRRRGGRRRRRRGTDGASAAAPGGAAPVDTGS